MKLVQKHNLNKHHCFGNPEVGINSMYWGCVEADGPKFGFGTLITPGAFDFVEQDPSVVFVYVCHLKSLVLSCHISLYPLPEIKSITSALKL